MERFGKRADDRDTRLRFSMEIYQVGLFYPREILIRVILIKQTLTSSMVVYYDKGKGNMRFMFVEDTRNLY